MDPVAFQNFLRLRDAAASRMQSTTPAPATRSAADWKAAIEGKRTEMGIATRPTTSYAVNDLRDAQSRTEALQAKMAMGTPVRRTGNLLDIRV